MMSKELIRYEYLNRESNCHVFENELSVLARIPPSVLKRIAL